VAQLRDERIIVLRMLTQRQMIFTLHAGEFLVGQELERKFKGKNVWMPTKDV
jgi:hypothetical protein